MVGLLNLKSKTLIYVLNECPWKLGLEVSEGWGWENKMPIVKATNFPNENIIHSLVARSNSIKVKYLKY